MNNKVHLIYGGDENYTKYLQSGLFSIFHFAILSLEAHEVNEQAQKRA